jgi:predicted transcriptional regulator
VGKEATLSTRIPRRIKAGLSALAEMTDRPVAWHVNQALSQYVELNCWQCAAMKQGMTSLSAGRLVRHEDVVAWVDSLGTDHEIPMPTRKLSAKSTGRRAVHASSYSSKSSVSSTADCGRRLEFRTAAGGPA